MKQAYVTVPFPATSVGSPPEVFHSCGKKCGKANVFGRRASARGAKAENMPDFIDVFVLGLTRPWRSVGLNRAKVQAETRFMGK